MVKDKPAISTIISDVDWEIDRQLRLERREILCARPDPLPGRDRKGMGDRLPVFNGELKKIVEESGVAHLSPSG